MKPIYLFADSQFLFWQSDGHPFLKEIRDQLTRGAPKVACISATNTNAPAFYTPLREAPHSIGVLDCRMICETYPDEDTAFLQRADLILLAGDNSAKDSQISQNLRDTLLECYLDGAVLISVAAGAVHLGRYPASLPRSCSPQSLIAMTLSAATV